MDALGALVSLALGAEVALYGLKYFTIWRKEVDYSKLTKHEAEHERILRRTACYPTPVDFLAYNYRMDVCAKCLEEKVAA